MSRRIGRSLSSPRLINKVSDLLENNTVLFVGYRLRDENVRHLLARIRASRRQWTRKAFAVGFYDEVRVKLLASLQIEVIETEADLLLTELARQAGALQASA